MGGSRIEETELSRLSLHGFAQNMFLPCPFALNRNITSKPQLNASSCPRERQSLEPNYSLRVELAVGEYLLEEKKVQGRC